MRRRGEPQKLRFPSGNSRTDGRTVAATWSQSFSPTHLFGMKTAVLDLFASVAWRLGWKIPGYLYTYKGIASFFSDWPPDETIGPKGVTTKTIVNWEKKAKLPVQHVRLGRSTKTTAVISVIALREWLNSRDAAYRRARAACRLLWFSVPPASAVVACFALLVGHSGSSQESAKLLPFYEGLAHYRESERTGIGVAEALRHMDAAVANLAKVEAAWPGMPVGLWQGALGRSRRAFLREQAGNLRGAEADYREALSRLARARTASPRPGQPLVKVPDPGRVLWQTALANVALCRLLAAREALVMCDTALEQLNKLLGNPERYAPFLKNRKAHVLYQIATAHDRKSTLIKESSGRRSEADAAAAARYIELAAAAAMTDEVKAVVERQRQRLLASAS